MYVNCEILGDRARGTRDLMIIDNCIGKLGVEIQGVGCMESSLSHHFVPGPRRSIVMCSWIFYNV